MRLLDERFGDSYVISEAFRNKLANWPAIKTHDKDALLELSDFVKQCVEVKKHVPGLERLDDGQENQRLLRQLPWWLVSKWRERIVEYRMANSNRYPPFELFADFLAERARVISEPITAALAPGSHSNSRKSTCAPSQSRQTQSTSLLATGRNGDNTGSNSKQPGEQKKACRFCNASEHYLADCAKFIETALPDRHAFVMKSRLCFSCLGFGHQASKCKQRLSCNVCGKTHPTCLHKDSVVSDRPVEHASNIGRATVADNLSRTSQASASVSLGTNRQTVGTGGFTTSIIPVWVSSSREPSKEILVYALIDSMSDLSFVLDDVYDQLNSQCEQTTLKLGTMLSPCEKVPVRKAYDLQVRSFDSSDKIVPLTPVHTRSFIPANKSAIPHAEYVKQWSHLRCIAAEVPNLLDCPVGLLIGYTCVPAFIPRATINGGDHEPFAIKTDLGWKIMGPDAPNRLDCDVIGITNLLMSIPTDDCDLQPLSAHTTVNRSLKCSQPIKETFARQVLHALESDFHDKASQHTMSQDDISFMNTMRAEIYQDEITKHYSMPLPFREAANHLTSNRQAVTHRLDLLKRKLARDSTYKSQYFSFMQSMLDSGEAEVVPFSAVDIQACWYIPHFGIKHPKKDKVRVVFDCSSKHRGVSLNSCLLQGPDCMNSLVGILMRFRLNRVALICDIEKMFYQFQVHESHRDYLRFLWFTDETMTHVADFRMTVHLFGATSSPACATYGLRSIATDHCDMDNEYSVLAKDFVTNSFYVDDGIISVTDDYTACELARHTRYLCSQGGVRLHKFVSNSIEVMKTIPKSEHADSIQSMDITQDPLPVERTLGILWSADSDKFQFSVTARETKYTRRALLSVVASVYDPLGWLAPFTLRGKQILQATCKAKLSWDDELPPEFREPWEQWLSELQAINMVSIPRQYWPNFNPFNDMPSVELHHFSDASSSGYGQCSFIRMLSQSGEVRCSLITGKARVAPSKIVTIPRLELQAAVLSTQLSQLVQSELCGENRKVQHHFWTDSTAVLGYISNDSRRFHMYVANRVQEIRELSEPSQWHYVRSEDNPADIASRSCNMSSLPDSWFHGPAFLYDANLNPNACKPPSDKVYVVNDTDPEVKCVLNSSSNECALPSQLDTLYDKILNISDWAKMLRVTQCFIRAVRAKAGQCADSRLELRHTALVYLVKNVQQVSFGAEISMINAKQGKQLPKSSPLHGLNPFVDSDGIIRVGGRCAKARWEYSERHPIILPKDSGITIAIIRHIHSINAHQGRQITVNAVRSQGFWIIGLSKVISRLIYHCVICRKERGKTASQRMADLPTARLEETPPFTVVGCDCFGPFLVKDNRKELKRYGVIYTCMYSRAVHIESLDDLSTDSFINSFRCVSAIRGPIAKVFCDNGTNFVGASSKLDCEFIFNPPTASHMGGVWERHIRTIRSILTNLLNKQPGYITSSELRTLLFECAAIINCRPLAVENLNDPFSQPLTPNQLLTMKSEVLLSPPGDFPNADLYSRTRWKRIQFLANQFWQKWKSQYITEIQKRSKWNVVKPNVRKDSIVLISDDNSPRNVWRMGRVIEVFKGDDDLVRRVKLFTGVFKGDKQQLVERPIHRLVVLLE